MKKLYSFLVEYEVGGEKRSRNVIIAKPTPRQLEEGEVEFAATVADYVRRGIFTRAMLFKKYEDLGGGVLPQSAEVKIADTYKEYVNKTLEFTRLESKKNPTAAERIEKTKLAEELTEIRSVLINAQEARDSIYNNSADQLAHRQLIFWWLFELVHVQEGDGTDDAPTNKLVKGSTFSERKDFWYDLQESDADFMKVAAQKIVAFIQFLYYNQSANEEDYVKFEKEFFPAMVEEMKAEDEAAKQVDAAQDKEPDSEPPVVPKKRGPKAK